VQQDIGGGGRSPESVKLGEGQRQPIDDSCGGKDCSDAANDDSAARGSVRLELDATDAAALRRILASLSGDIAAPRSSGHGEPEKALARLLFETRKSRARLFPPSMFNEPAWDMLVALYIMDEAPAATDLAKLTNTPLTTAMRWIVYLEVHKLIIREPCAEDRRVQKIRLTEQARSNLQTLLSELVASLPGLP
jgi:DNA-binding MarR family transcriptional regulator